MEMMTSAMHWDERAAKFYKEDYEKDSGVIVLPPSTNLAHKLNSTSGHEKKLNLTGESFYNCYEGPGRCTANWGESVGRFF